MGKATVFLMAALALALAAADAMPPPAAEVARRSRFLAGKAALPPPPSYFNCGKKLPSVCLEKGSPGATCCKGTCVDTQSSFAHCGMCDKTCKYGQTCCAGKCADLLTDEHNCGVCFNQCPEKNKLDKKLKEQVKSKCQFGLCDYAG